MSIWAMAKQSVRAELRWCFAQELSVSIWAMAKLGYHPGRILADFGRRIEELMPGFNTQACSNTLWGLSVLQVRTAPVWKAYSKRWQLEWHSRAHADHGVMGFASKQPSRTDHMSKFTSNLRMCRTQRFNVKNDGQACPET